MSAVDVLAVMGRAELYLDSEVIPVLRAKRAVAELMEAVETILDPHTPISVNAQYERLASALARCKGEGA